MFFRFCKLYELGIRPVFVFDGPNRPEYKRDKFINTVPMNTEFRRNLMSMIQLFNFSKWEAYGEAEAECAMLQRLGFVDVVFTGDSDILLFGGSRVVRQWPAKRHEPVACYDMQWVMDTTGLDRSDLILIALLRGSDYDTKGTRGIGIKVAAQLAKCHFHRGLMDDILLAGRDIPLDDERVQHLYDDLMYELEHNSKKLLSRKHGKVVLDPKFPDFSIVVDFIHPLTNISSSDPSILAKAKKLQENLDFYHEPDWLHLTPFSQYAFHWPADYLLKRFTSVLYPGYMASRLRRQQPHYNYTRFTKQKRQSSQLTSSQQTLVSDFFRSTRKPQDSQEEADLVQITASKVLSGSLKLYRVEWSRKSWETFIEKLKPQLDYELKTSITSSQIEVEYEDEVDDMPSSQQASKSEKEPWQLVKRQWVNAIHIHNAYPKLAIDFKETQDKRRRSMKGQTKLDSFLILPPKRKSNIPY